jgi:signal transduction histidine kinase
MNANAPITAGVAPLEPTWVDARPAQRWTRPLTVVVIGFVVITTFQTAPVPGAHAQHLGVLLALIGIGIGTAGLLGLTRAAPGVHMALLILVVLSSATLVDLQPNGPGFFGVFPAVGAAALTLPARRSPLVAAIAVTALAAGWALEGSRPFVGVVLNELGVVAFYLVAMFARRLREANDQAHRLINELEETRAAQTQAAALGERQRLAREMHDVLAHSLSGLVLNLEGARLLAEQSGADPGVGDAIERAHRLAKTGLEEARRAIGMLRDDALPGPERLADLAAEFQSDSGVPCLLTVTGVQSDLGPDSRLTLYRVAQEALTNIRKHARADRVDLRLDYEKGGVRLSVEDRNAEGDLPAPGDGTGYGLTGMRERAELLGGTLTTGPTQDGFRVELWVPR